MGWFVSLLESAELPAHERLVPDIPSWERRHELGLVRAWVQTVFELKTPSTFAPRTPESGYTLLSPLLFAVIGGSACGLGFLLGRILSILEDIYVHTSGIASCTLRVDGFALFVDLSVPSVGAPIVFVAGIALWAALAHAYIRCTHPATCPYGEVFRIFVYSIVGKVPGYALLFPFIMLPLALMRLVPGAPPMGGWSMFHSNATLILILAVWAHTSVRPFSQILQAVHGVRYRDAWLAALLPGFLLYLSACLLFFLWLLWR